MIKTTYQTPEIRNANDEIVQEGAFGKNTALSNSTNDGWIDYVVNNLEALHDTIGDSAATLDGNGHVVEPANLAIGDEDGNRLKTSYLKLTGGTVSGTLNVQQNLKFQDNQENVFGGVYIPSSSATEQYAQFYGGEGTGVAGAKLTLYPDGDGRFKLDARSTDGANTYTLVTDNNGNLNWRGYPLAWKKDYLPLAGGTMTGELKIATIKNAGTDAVRISGGVDVNQSTGAMLTLFHKDHANSGWFRLFANNGTGKILEGRPDGTLTWGGNAIALTKDVLPLTGGTMTGAITLANGKGVLRSYSNGTYLYGETASNSSQLVIYTNDSGDGFRLNAGNGSIHTPLVGKPDGSLTWNGNQLGLQKNTNNYVQLGGSASGTASHTFTFASNMVTIIARRGSNYGMYCVDVWDTGAVTMVSGGTSPLSIAHEANSHEVTITNVTGSAVVVQIIRSDSAW